MTTITSDTRSNVWRLEADSCAPYTIVRATTDGIIFVDHFMAEQGDYIITNRNSIFDLDARGAEYFEVEQIDCDDNQVSIGEYATTTEAVDAIVAHAA